MTCVVLSEESADATAGVFWGLRHACRRRAGILGLVE
jgi:hypothetical protein